MITVRPLNAASTMQWMLRDARLLMAVETLALFCIQGNISLLNLKQRSRGDDTSSLVHNLLALYPTILVSPNNAQRFHNDVGGRVH